MNRLAKPSGVRPVSVDAVIDPRLALLARKQAALNELKVSVRESKEHTGELEQRCARLELEIAELTASLRA